jgi:hypothetical protein
MMKETTKGSIEKLEHSTLVHFTYVVALFPNEMVEVAVEVEVSEFDTTFNIGVDCPSDHCFSDLDQSDKDDIEKEFKAIWMEAYPDVKEPVIDVLKRVVAKHQHETVEFPDGGEQIVDGFTASAMMAVYNAINAKNQAGFADKVETLAGFLKISAFAFSKCK